MPSRITYQMRNWVKPEIIQLLKTSDKVQSSKDICEYINSKKDELQLEKPLTPGDVRLLINEIRSLCEAPICATSKGYFFSYKQEDLFNSARSLEHRLESIKAAADGLRKMLGGQFKGYDF